MPSSSANSLLMFAACIPLIACGAISKPKDPWNMYDVQPMPATQGGYVVPRDNDTDYSKPGSYSCTTINDAPSCSGGG